MLMWVVAQTGKCGKALTRFMGARLHLVCPIVKQFSNVVNIFVHVKIQGSLDQQYLAYSPISDPLMFLSLFMHCGANTYLRNQETQ
jgi:hypothetical protein